MLGLPRSMEVNLPFPKQKLYEHAQMSATLKKKFIDQIESITWRNKLSLEKINLSKGAYVEEIEIMELKLRADHVDDKVLRLIDKAIPYRLIFVLSRNGRYQLCAAYDDGSTVGKYFRSDWGDVEQEIERLRRKIPSEKQFNRQLEMRGRLKHLQNELERLRNGSSGG
ncbi:MAG: DUF4391 domain-containing protein [Selenomonadaceae bacterium]|nr:DUF4391 domain-containing protein [Selenomonadaceae bacterium]